MAQSYDYPRQLLTVALRDLLTAIRLLFLLWHNPVQADWEIRHKPRAASAAENTELVQWLKADLPAQQATDIVGRSPSAVFDHAYLETLDYRGKIMLVAWEQPVKLFGWQNGQLTPLTAADQPSKNSK